MDKTQQEIDAPVLFSFGKYKNQPVALVRQNDPQYLDWLIGQAWFKEKFPRHYTVIINCGAAQDHTPAHNAMQALFLDDPICYKVIAATRPYFFKDLECCTVEGTVPSADRKGKEWKPLENVRAHLLPGASRTWSDYNEGHHRAVTSTPAQLVGEKVGRFPERQGWDWVFHASFRCNVCEKQLSEVHVEADQRLGARQAYLQPITIGLELKPTLGDDYPAVIRQIQQHGNLGQYSSNYEYRAVVVGRYTGEGASLEQVRKIFEAARITLVLLSDVQKCDLL